MVDVLMFRHQAVALIDYFGVAHALEEWRQLFGQACRLGAKASPKRFQHFRGRATFSCLWSDVEINALDLHALREQKEVGGIANIATEMT